MTAPASSKTPALRDPVEHAVRLLDQQAEAIDRLWAISERQRDLIAKGNTVELLQLLPTRRRWIDTVRAIAERLKPHAQGLTAAQPADAGWARARTLHQSVGERLEALRIRDREDCDALAKARKAVADERARLAAGRGTAQAYRAAPASTPPRFTDRVG
ncbi:MAG: hypothetical protein AAGA57_12085 [Planctomycetota bacterium]